MTLVRALLLVRVGSHTHAGTQCSVCRAFCSQAAGHTGCRSSFWLFSFVSIFTCFARCSAMLVSSDCSQASDRCSDSISYANAKTV